MTDHSSAKLIEMLGYILVAIVSAAIGIDFLLWRLIWIAERAFQQLLEKGRDE